MDLQALINASMEDYIKEKLPEKTAQYLEKMIDSVLDDLFSRYGDSSKQIKQVLSEKIQLDLTNLSLIDYNGMIATAIQNHFNHLAMQNAVDPIMKLMGEVVGKKLPYEDIHLNDIFEKIKEITMEWLDHGDEGEVSFYASYNQKYDWIEVWADKDAYTSKRNCGVYFMFSWGKATKEKWGGTIFSMQFRSYGWNTKSSIDIATLDGVEKYIHQLYMSWVKIYVDHDDLEDGEMDFEREFEVDLL